MQLYPVILFIKLGISFTKPLRAIQGKCQKECYAKAEDILKKLKFKEPKRILNSYPFELSGGMNQRVALAFSNFDESQTNIGR